MKKSFLLAFNKQLKELLNKLNMMIPNNEDLKFAKNMFHVPLMTKENIYLEQFYAHALPHEEHIMTKNEEFSIGDEDVINEKNNNVHIFIDLFVGGLLRRL